MFRDKYKDEKYFKEARDFTIESFREMEELKPEISEERMTYFYSPQSLYSKELVSMSYSLGLSSDEILNGLRLVWHTLKSFILKKEIYTVSLIIFH